MSTKQKRIFVKSFVLAAIILMLLLAFLIVVNRYTKISIKNETEYEIKNQYYEASIEIEEILDSEIKNLDAAVSVFMSNGLTDRAVEIFDEWVSSDKYEAIGIVKKDGTVLYGEDIDPHIYTNMAKTFEGKSGFFTVDSDGDKPMIAVSIPVYNNNTSPDALYAVYSYDSFNKNIMSGCSSMLIVDSETNQLISNKLSKDDQILYKEIVGNEGEKKINIMADACQTNSNYYNEETDSYMLFSKTAYNDWVICTIIDADLLCPETKQTSLVCVSSLTVLCLILFLITIRSLFGNEKNKEEMFKLAYYDKLTGLPKTDKIKIEASSMDNNKKYALVIIDIDNFKLVNDLFGYSFGDTVLRNVAAILIESANEKIGERAFRLNNDCFGIILICKDGVVPKDRISDIMEKITDATCKNNYRLELSCGVNVIDGRPDDIAAIIDGAIIAMKTIKNKNDAIAYYDGSFKEKLIEDLEIENDMERAMKEEEFVVFLQPKYDLDGDKLAGAEALVRWKHKDKGMLFPGKFIPLFEANGSIGKLDLYMLNLVCRKIREWMDEGMNVYTVSVNLSRVQLNNPKLAQELDDIVSSHNVPKELINFELTETAYFDDVNKLLSTMNTLKDLGYTISMDDFGAGYSSLSLLQKMPLDVLKLDKSLLDDLNCNDLESKTSKVIKDVILMANHLDIQTLAEGVEEADQRDFLKASGCNQVQGYFYAKPMPVEDFEKLLQEEMIKTKT